LEEMERDKTLGKKKIRDKREEEKYQGGKIEE